MFWLLVVLLLNLNQKLFYSFLSSINKQQQTAAVIEKTNLAQADSISLSLLLVLSLADCFAAEKKQ